MPAPDAPRAPDAPDAPDAPAPPVALVRGVPATFDRALAATPPDPPIDVTLARAQHAAYVDGLRWLGYDVVVLPTQDAHPDGCFVEDAAVVADGVALVARAGAPSRRGEAEAVAAALAARGAVVHRMEEPATLDGGDVLRLGRRLFVGRSPRTNDAGIARLVEVFAPRGLEVAPVPLPPGTLHLKCLCAPLGPDRVLLADGALSPDLFASAAVVRVPAAEAYAANALARRGRVLVAAGHPLTRRALEAAGLEVREIPTSEFRKADGALTCLSIPLDPDPR